LSDYDEKDIEGGMKQGCAVSRVTEVQTPTILGGPDTHDPRRSRHPRSSEVQTPTILGLPGVQTPTIPRGPEESSDTRDLHDPHEFRHPRSPRFPDTGEARSFKLASPMWSFSVGYLTRQADWILLTSTVIVDMVSVMNARRCFRSLTDAHIRPAPDRR
jgi:hypothetical protein